MKNNNKRISIFIQVYGDRVWNALKKEFIELSSEEIEFINNNRNNFDILEYPQRLYDLGIITSDWREKELIKYLKKITTDNQFQSLYLITTTNCNLDCDYCFYRSSSSQSLQMKENMSFDIAKQSMNDFKKIISNNIKDNDYWEQITFYGGEPLINRNLLYQAIPYARMLFGSDINVVINTNATLLIDSDIELFRKYNVEVQVSLDGNREQHNLHRKTSNGELTYDIVISNMKRLLNNGVKVLPMITATDANIHNFSEVLLEISRELRINDFAVNVLITNSYGVEEEYTEILSSEMLRAYKEFGEIATDCVFVELYQKLLGIDKSISKNSCGSSRKITVFPNGKVYACQALEKVAQNYMGTLSTDYAKNSNWECWRNRSRFDNSECLECSSVLSCGGGCATGSFNLNSSIYDLDKNNCEYTRKLFKKIHNV